MGDIIKFPQDLKETSYIGIDEYPDYLGVTTKDKKLEIGRDASNLNKFIVRTPDGTQIHDRKSLAEFLHVVQVFVDSEKRWDPMVDELVGSDY